MDDDHIYLDYDGQFYPYCYVTKYNVLTGAYVELWKMVARLMKKRIVWTLNRGWYVVSLELITGSDFSKVVQLV